MIGTEPLNRYNLPNLDCIHFSVSQMYSYAGFLRACLISLFIKSVVQCIINFIIYVESTKF